MRKNGAAWKFGVTCVALCLFLRFHGALTELLAAPSTGEFLLYLETGRRSTQAETAVPVYAPESPALADAKAPEALILPTIVTEPTQGATPEVPVFTAQDGANIRKMGLPQNSRRSASLCSMSQDSTRSTPSTVKIGTSPVSSEIRMKASASQPSQSRRFRCDSSPIGRAKGYNNSQFIKFSFQHPHKTAALYRETFVPLALFGNFLVSSLISPARLGIMGANSEKITGGKEYEK